MKKVIVFLLLILAIDVNSQSISQRGIPYIFSSEIDTIIYTTIKAELFEKMDTAKHSYYIILGSVEGDTMITIYMDFYCHSCRMYDDKGAIENWIRYLVENSNRYYTGCLVDSLPLIFYSDLTYSQSELSCIDGHRGGIMHQMRWEFREQFYIKAHWAMRQKKIYEIGINPYGTFEKESIKKAFHQFYAPK